MIRLASYWLLWAAARLLTHSLYRIRRAGVSHVPARGPALLVSNHVSLIDALLIATALRRPVRFLMHRSWYERRWLNWISRLLRAIPVSDDGRQAIRGAREELSAGGLVCIFAEGAITRTGNLLPFKRGLELIAGPAGAPIVPVHLDGIWGGYRQGRLCWTWPRRIPYTATVSFGPPMPPDSTALQVRAAVEELSIAAAGLRRSRHDTLDRMFVRSAKRHPRRLAIADSSGAELSYGRALASVLVLSRWLRKRTAGEETIGILLPPSTGGALANLAATLAGKVPVNLNFKLDRERLDSAIAQCGLRTILTSTQFVNRAKIAMLPGMTFLEEARLRVTKLQKLRAAVEAFAMPAFLLEALYCDRRAPDSLAAIIFTSGSTGMPKGVMMSHGNILGNVESVARLFPVTSADRMAGILPFFHTMGLTCTIWFPLLNGIGVAYHPNPMEAHATGELVAKYRATFLTSTPTFAASYVRKCTPAQFSSLRYVIVGGEKLRPRPAEAFREKFGQDLLEGYGCTEMSPIVAVNVAGGKPGSVGRLAPNVAVKVVDPATGRLLGPNQPGLLLANGPNRMLGYYRDPERTAKVLRGGWYVTGDVGAIDDEGFLWLTGRLARFSKVGAEMVPHAAVEEHIAAIIGDEYECVVVGLANGPERLAALYTRPGVSPAELHKRLRDTGLRNLWIPKPENLVFVEALPRLPTGRIDLERAKAMLNSGTGYAIPDPCELGIA